MTEPKSQTTVIAEGLAFPESPRWHDGRFYFSDMGDDRVYVIDDAGATEVVAELPWPSGLGWLPDGRMQVVSMLTNELHRFADGQEPEKVSLGPVIDSHANDMVVDDSGGAYIGQLGFNVDDLAAGKPIQARPSPFAFVGSDGQVKAAAADLVGANGCALTADGGTLILAETPVGRLTQFDVDDDGTLSGRQVFAELGEAGDGICLDEEGAVWVGLCRQDRFVRVAKGGEILDTIELATPERRAIAPMLGGPDGRTLYMCTNSVNFPLHGREARAGQIETAQVEAAAARRST